MTARLTRTELTWLAAIAVAILLIHLPSLGNQLVFDDAQLADGRIFTEYASAFELKVRWLSYGSFVWVQELLGEGWWKQRLVNVAIHLAVVAALWAFYREILAHIEPPPPDEPGQSVVPYQQSPALGFALAFFALNPVAVYAVDYLVQRSILMATLFVVLGLFLFARALRGKPWLHAPALACYVAAMMSKEHAMFAPLAAIPVYVIVERPSVKRLAGLAAAGITVAAAGAIAMAMRYGDLIGKPFDEFSNVYLAQLAALAPGADRDAWPLSILNQAWLFFHYGLRWLLPAAEWMSINLRPPFPVTLLSWPHALGALLYTATILGGAFLVLRWRDWRALLGLSLLMPALLFATEFATVWVQDPFVLYRSYLWAIGVPGLVLIAFHGVPGRVLAVVSLLACVLLAWQALDRVFSLATPERAWTDAIAKLPNDPRSVGRWFPYLNRGSAYVDANKFNLAMNDFEASSKLGDMGLGMFNRGSLYAANSEHVNALASFDIAQGQGYNLYSLPFQRGLTFAAMGRPAEAYAQFEAARAMRPASPTRELVLLGLGRAAMQSGRPDEALAALRQLLATEPGNREGRYYLAMALTMKGEHAEALGALDTLVKDEGSLRAYYGRALAHYGLKQKAPALADIDEAIRRSPDAPHLKQWRTRIQALP